MATPVKPAEFTAAGVPAGFEVKLVPFADERPGMVARAVHFHTNGASVPVSVQSQWNYAVARPHQNTLPTYALGLSSGGRTPAAKFLQSNRRAIGSTTVSKTTTVNGKLVWPTLTLEQQQEILAHPNVREQTIVVETADTGYLADPRVSPFDPGQIEACATLLAYESIVHGIPLVIQTAWWGPGVASHTDPFGFPYTSIHRGKICPGDRKKEQVRNVILPRAREIVAAWKGSPAPEPVPPPPGPLPQLRGVLDMVLMAHESGKATFWFSPDGGVTRYVVRDMDHALSLVAIGAIDAKTRTVLTAANWGNASVLSVAELDRRLGRAVT